MIDGIIELDSERGKELGFTRDKFDGYLWKVGESVVISFIASRKRGNFRNLVSAIHSKGWSVEVPTPLGRMRQIVGKNGYTRKVVPFSDEIPDECEVWVKSP